METRSGLRERQPRSGGLGRTYVEDERFRHNIGGGNDALVDYLCAAMAEYARTRLG